MWRLGWCALLGWLWMPGPAHACQVELLGAPSAAWQEAAASLPTAPSPGTDCAVLLVDVDAEGATLTFTTLDGRRAQRRLAQPDELSPTVTALRVAAPPPSALAADPPETPAAAPAATPVAAAAAAPAAKPTEPALGLLFSFLAGVRTGDSALLSPVLMSMLQLDIQRWELGLSLAWEARYYQLDGGRPLARTQLVPALAFARRQPLGRCALLAGTRLGFGLLFPAYAQTIDYPAQGDPPLAAQESYEGRLGVLVGVTVPRESSVRFRAELGADFVFWHSASPSSSESGSAGFVFPELSPEWALTALVGVEFGGT